jgi:hypothetical protein
VSYRSPAATPPKASNKKKEKISITGRWKKKYKIKIKNLKNKREIYNS